MGSQQSFQPTPSLITVPSNYPNFPTPGKLQILWEGNSKKLYHRLSPYANYDQNSGLIKGFTIQPYWYVYPDENNKGLNALKRYESRVFPLGSAPIDVIRTAKFLGSGNGILFLGKQFLLQTGNPYNETRIYNPTSPLIAAGMGLSLGTVRPQRNFDTSGGLGGIARTLIGNAIPDALFGAPKINPPSGTVASALPDVNSTTGGKGLLRAGTAGRGLSHLQAAWPQNTKGQGLTSTFKSVVSGLAKSLFANFIPQNQSGFIARSDEGAYGMMVGAGSTKFKYIGVNGEEIGFGQQWIAGGKNIRKNGQYPNRPTRIFNLPDGKSIQLLNDNLQPRNLKDVGSVGYTVTESSNSTKPGYRYGDNLGVTKDEEYGASDIMLQYASYSVEKNKYPTKKTDNNAVRDVRVSLRRVLDKLNSASEELYTIEVPNNARAISSGLSTKNGYDRLYATNKRFENPKNFPQGVLQDYRDTRNVDNTLTNNAAEKSLKLPTAGQLDGLNTLTVLNKDQKIGNNLITGWTKWNPYVDDQIAFFFYDVVNEKYIPFRAAIKGVNESATATWEEMSVIGRGDKVYSYAGFNRNLSFGLKIVISSIAELAPTWQRINYLMTLIKPANYTTATVNNVTNRFMVPPMVMMTLGDLYKDQPILIQSIGMTIPDDATWETQNEFNSQQWSYLANYLKTRNNTNVFYGQLPREVELSLGVVLLEKERAIVGGASFGHAPRTEDWSQWNTDTLPTGGVPNKLHKSLVVNVVDTGDNQQLLDAGTPFNNATQQNANIA
jgi:hypothetical protein